jgi:hypothetical protein
MSVYDWKEKIKIKRLVLNDERETYHLRLNQIEKRKSEILKHILGWSSLKSAVGVGGTVVLSNPLVLVAARSLVSVTVSLGFYLYTDAAYEGRRIEADFHSVRAPLLRQLNLLEKALGSKVRLK